MTESKTPPSVQLQFFGKIGISVDGEAKRIPRSEQKLLAYLVLAGFNLEKARNSSSKSNTQYQRVHARQDANDVLYPDFVDRTALNKLISRFADQYRERIDFDRNSVAFKLFINADDRVDVFDFIDAFRARQFETAIKLYKGPFLAGLEVTPLNLTSGTQADYEKYFIEAVTHFAEIVTSTRDEATLQNALEVLTDARSVKPGSETITDAIEKIRYSLSTIRGHVDKKVDQSFASAEESTTQQLILEWLLKPPPDGFFGREEEIKNISDDIRKGKPTVYTLWGLAGIGKTDFALKIAHKIKDNYPNGQLFIDMHGFTRDEPLVEPETVMIRLVQRFYPSFRPKNDDETRAAYLQVLEEYKLLIFVDNVRTKAQVEALVPPTGTSLLLITTRHRLVVKGTSPIPVGGLDVRDAKKMLVSRVGANKLNGKEEELANLLECIPVALDLAAGAVQSDAIDIDWYIGTFKNKYRNRAVLIRSRIETSYDILLENRRLALLWRSLFVIENGFTAAFVEMSGVGIHNETKDDITGLLSQLVDMSLLSADSTRPCYGMHDLLRAYCATRNSKRARFLARKQYASAVLTYFTSVVALRDLTVTDRSYIKLQNLEPDIPPIFEWVSDHFDKLGDLYSVFTNAVICASGRYSLELTVTQQEKMLLLAITALAASRSDNTQNREFDNQREATLQVSLADLYLWSFNDLARAVERYRQAIRVHPDGVDPHFFQRLQAKLCELTGLADEAIKLYIDGVHLAQNRGDTANEVEYLHSLTSYCTRSSRFKEGLRYAREALAIANKVKDCSAASNSLCNIGAILLAVGRFGPAIRSYEAAFNLMPELLFEEGAWKHASNVAAAHLSQGDVRHALRIQIAVMKDLEKKQDLYGLFPCMVNLGTMFAALPDIDQAILCFYFLVSRSVSPPTIVVDMLANQIVDILSRNLIEGALRPESRTHLHDIVSFLNRSESDSIRQRLLPFLLN